ncbi:MAG: hypothetical protein IKG23_09040 [Clostridia bacterium]|nr:hypothetical protein [Clostridia bacterium]
MAHGKDYDFSMEKRLRQLDPQLHRRFTDAVFALQYSLSHYKLIFPEYTDHTNLHSMTVIDFCNRLIGDRIDRLNADELYVLLMGCYFHDTGMGITLRDYEDFSGQVDFGSYFDSHPRDDLPAVIRTFHHEYSGHFIRKYADLFDIPSPEHKQAIIQISRGHRKTDLMDEKEYPLDFAVPNGNRICLPYLSALIRLADEIDVAAARNPVLLYDIDALTDETQIVESKKVKAVRRLLVSESSFTLEVSTPEAEILEQIRRLAEKMQNTLDYCRAVVIGRTPYTITQEKVLLDRQPEQAGIR